MSCLKSQYGIPIRELWDGFHPKGFEKGCFVIFRGYMDESGNAESMIFTLSCIIGDGPAWFYLERDWIIFLDSVNKNLESQGRKQISRYHTADCNSLENEFSGWSKEEQYQLTKGMLDCLRPYKFDVLSYSINIGELVTEIPEITPNPKGFAYVIVFSYLMLAIRDFTLSRPAHKDALISLHHDHCDYDSALQEAFNHIIEDETFKAGHRFLHLTAEHWQTCIPLQPADILAYENFKEAERYTIGRKRRKSLDLILDLDSIGGRALGLNPKALRQFFLELDDYTKEILLLNARVRKQKSKKRSSSPIGRGHSSS